MSNLGNRFVGALLLVAPALFSPAADRPWQRLTMPTAMEATAQFANPPPEYSATITWGWNGPMTEEVITRDLDAIRAKGLRAATIEAGYNMDNAPYLSDGWFKLIRFAAEEAEKRDMRLWIIDEGKYPSGFAGGKFTQERPDLRMQGLGIAERIDVATGEAITRKLAPEVVGALAIESATGENRALDTHTGTLTWTAPPEGKWQVVIVDHQFRTPVTRAVNDPTQAKTDKNSMGDLINPAATRQFIEWTHEAYRKHMGDLFGRVILGLRGDEPDFGATPWTPRMLEEFQSRKGYDVRPYLASFVSLGRNGPPLKLSEAQRRAKADYWDVWSELFAKHFFSMQAEWCAANGVEYTVHLNNDHLMPALVRSTGDFFRAMRDVQIPGVDVIWNQVWPGKVADFPKFASSAAHMYGHPRALSESFAAFTPPPTLEQVRFGVNYQLVRGITLFEFMFYGSSVPRTRPTPANPSQANAAPRVRRYLDEPEFSALGEYTHRAGWLLSQGRPAAQIAVYCPTSSLWLGEDESNATMMKIAQQLTEAQRDFDFADENALASAFTLEGAAFRNLSGQSYRAIVIPGAAAISRAALDRLQTFAKAGGAVVFVGRDPAMIVEKSFLEARAPGDLAWARHERTGEITPAVLAALPKPDVALDQPASAIKVMHRRLADADVYFFFNEGEASVSRVVQLAGSGDAWLWDASSGKVARLGGATVSGGQVRIPLVLERFEAKIIVVGATAPAVAVR